MTRDRLVGTALLSPVLLAIAFSLVRLIAEGADVPDDGDYVAAAAFLDERKLTGDDAIVILPPWSLRPLMALGNKAPRVVGADGPWWPLVDHRFARLFVIEEPDGAIWKRGTPPATTTKTFGSVIVSEHALGSARFDFKARLAAAGVDVDGVPCIERVKLGVHCAGRPPWQRVTREWALVTENGREIIFAHPPPSGGKLTIAFDDVELGSKLVIAAGHTREGAEHASGPVRLQVKVDDDVIATLVRAPSFVVEPARAFLRETFVEAIDPQGQGFRVDDVDTARFAGSKHRVAFVIDADDEASQHFGFDAFVPAP
ncbi:MAG: hypothetical protein Q8O67_22070 [Deltaproteobacteria bacterium]|nr:hypothetical protein [Deltaproteobacteria bacterium]